MRKSDVASVSSGSEALKALKQNAAGFDFKGAVTKPLKVFPENWESN
jgi:hypothetical protein